MDKAWKAYERWVAKRFNTARIPALGKEDADVMGGGCWIDYKLRKEVPRAWFHVMDAAELLGYNTVVYHDTVIMRAISTMGLLHGHIQEQNIRFRGDLPGKPLEWLTHIAESSPDNLVAAVVMNVPRTLHTASLFIADADRWLFYRNALVLSARGEQGG